MDDKQESKKSAEKTKQKDMRTCTEPDEVQGPFDDTDRLPKYEIHNDRLGLFSRASLASSELISDSYLMSNEKQLRALELEAARQSMLGRNKNLTSQLSSPSATNKTLGPRSKVDSATAKKSETDNLKILQQKMH